MQNGNVSCPNAIPAASNQTSPLRSPASPAIAVQISPRRAPLRIKPAFAKPTSKQKNPITYLVGRTGTTVRYSTQEHQRAINLSVESKHTAEAVMMIRSTGAADSRHTSFARRTSCGVVWCDDTRKLLIFHSRRGGVESSRGLDKAYAGNEMKLKAQGTEPKPPSTLTLLAVTTGNTVHIRQIRNCLPRRTTERTRAAGLRGRPGFEANGRNRQRAKGYGALP